MSVWNGASYYVEVFGRRFEKELLALKQEMELMQTTESVVSGASGNGDKAEGEASEGEAAAAASGLPQSTEEKKEQ